VTEKKETFYKINIKLENKNNIRSYRMYYKGKGKGKGKAVPLQASSGPEGSRKLRFPDYMTTAQEGGKVVSLTHQPPLLKEMLLVLISVRG
jgi:hypothetical protein